MGTTLTGTTPQDTYDSLIKVTDNGPLSGTAKYLSDGLGNDSVLALSTSAVGIGTTTLSEFVQLTKSQAATTRLQITNPNTGGGTATRASLRVTANDRIGEIVALNGDYVYVGAASNHNVALMSNGAGVLFATPAGNVGIGTSAPEALLDLYSASGVQLRLANATTGTDATDGTRIYLSGSDLFIVNRENAPIKFFTSDTERFAITNNGVTFNGDTAAANALDDYEEGTFDFGIAFGGASVGVTYSLRGGTYTKIGRQVTVNGLIQLTNKGSSTGNATITGLPFTVANTFGNYSSASLRFSNVTFANQFQAFTAGNTTIIELEEVTEAGVTSALTNADIADNAVIIVSLTYFV
jgi:hypothetical protein